MITRPPATLPKRIPSDSADDMFRKISPARRRGKGLRPRGVLAPGSVLGRITKGGAGQAAPALGEPFALVIYYSSGAIW